MTKDPNEEEWTPAEMSPRAAVLEQCTQTGGLRALFQDRGAGTHLGWRPFAPGCHIWPFLAGRTSLCGDVISSAYEWSQRLLANWIAIL